MSSNKNFINLPSISSYKDNINIGDVNNEATYTEIGGKTGLDVNIINNTDASLTPTISNISVVLSGTEYSYFIPVNTKRYVMRVRDAKGKLQFAYTSGDTNTKFISLARGATYTQEGVYLSSGLNVYFESPTANVVVEILSWV